jgi:hypothetical protein
VIVDTFVQVKRAATGKFAVVQQEAAECGRAAAVLERGAVYH